MNRIYRLVFNRALGVLQVASELARPAGGAAAAGTGQSTAVVRAVSFAVWVAMGWVGVVTQGSAQQAPAVAPQAVATGRIVTDPGAPKNQRPTVVTAPNGTPLVNITTPSTAGVSRNAYTQFDVGTQGAILNNSRTNTQTELGGWVQGNPWLATGTARIILNEVNSANPSYLNGYVEVAGDRAEVVIANPAGIQVDGGGFLNASRATLTTGRPVFNGGSLDHYRVEGGAIGVSGAGLDASRTGHTQLLARSVQVNAGIWAQELSVTTGSNTVGASDGAIQRVAPTTTAAGVAIDVGQLGGMYAGKIALVGTEHGVGVRNAGAIGAQAGDLVVTVDGRLENTGSLQALQDAQISAGGGVANAGMLSAGRELSVRTPADVDNRGGTLNAMRLQVDAGALRNQDGAIEQTGMQALTLDAGALSNRNGGRIGETGADPDAGSGTPGQGTGTPGGGDAGNGGDTGAGQTGGENGQGGTVPTTPVVPLADGALRIAGLLDNDGGRISAGGGIGLATDQGLDNAGGRLGLRSLTIGRGDLLNASGTLTVTGEAHLDVGTFDNEAGIFQVNDMLSLRAGTLSNREGQFLHGGTDDTRIDVAGTLDNSEGTLASNAASLRIAAGDLLNTRGLIQQAGTQGLAIATGRLDGNQGTIASAGALTLSAGDIAHREATLSARQVSIEATGLDNTAGQIVATGREANRIGVTGTLDNTGGLLVGNGDLAIAADTFLNTQGVVQQAGDGVLAIEARTLEGEDGTLASNGSLSIAGETTNLRNGVTSARRIAIDTGDLTTAGGQVAAIGTEALVLHARGTLDNTGGTIGGNGAIDLSARAFTNTQGVVQAAGTLPSTFAVAGELDNHGGVLQAAGDTVVQAGTLSNLGGVLQVAGASHLSVGVDGLLDNRDQGMIASGGDLSLIAQELDNREGMLAAGGDLDAMVEAGIDNAGGIVQAGGLLALSSDGLVNADGTIIGGQARIDTRGHAFSNDGGILASTAGGIDIRSGALHNTAGLVQSADGLALDTAGQAVTNRDAGAAGGLFSAGRMDLRTGDFDNRAGVVFAQGDAHLQAGAIDNADGGRLGSAADLSVRGDRLSNTDGTMQAGGSGQIALTGLLDNRGGSIAANEALQLAASAVDNRDTLSTSAATPLGLQADVLHLQADGLDNREGQILSGSLADLRLAGLLDNADGQVSSGGDLRVTADAVRNTGGTLLSGGDQTLAARTLSGDGRVLSQGDATLTLQEDFSNTGEVIANGTLALATEGDLHNAGLLQAGHLELQADRIDNAADGEISAVGLAHLVAREELSNRGLIDGFVTHIEAAVVDNLGSGRIYGDHVAIDTAELRNRDETVGGAARSATIAARQQLDLGVGTLANTGGGLIYSDGHAAIGGALDADRMAVGTADRIDNLSSTIEVAGDLDMQSLAVNNLRENVVVTQTTTVLDPVRLDQPHWRNNGSNATSNIRNTSNYSAYEVYYLHPDDILEDTPYITPDGFTVRRAVIRLTPQTSAYFFARGGLYGALGERSRLNVQDGTVTVYYFGRQDNQANPDQVASGADDPFTEVSAPLPGDPAFQYVNDGLTYSNAYGTCTTNCVQLWAQYDYDDPDHILVNPRGTGGGGLGDNERYRIATRTVTEDVLAPGAGADAVIHAGGAMRIGTDALVNRYGRIAAGDDLVIEGLTAAASVTNIGQTLYRTHDFDNVTHAYNGTTRAWSNPSISEQIGQIGGVITSGGTLTVDVGDLDNLDEGRDAPNVQAGGALANLNPQAPGSGPTAPVDTPAGGPEALSGYQVDTAIAAGPQAVLGGNGPAIAAVEDGGAVAGDAVEQAAGGSPGTVATATLDAQLPTGSLFTVQPNGGSYLVETDPRFADYRNWLGSDYLLDALGYDPAGLHKRLGDGYYEQKLVREQIGQLTGRRFLAGYGNDEDQFRALMEAGALFAQQYGLRPGVALSAEQMAQLTSDIVWLVEQTVTLADGSTATVLVPQVYLRLQPGDMSENGALLAGENVRLNLRGNLVNTGDIAGRQVVSIDAANIDNLAGGAIRGRAVGLQATQDINVIGATVTAQDVLSVRAGGDVIVASTTQTLAGGGFHRYEQTSLDRVAVLYVTNPGGLGVLNVNAGGDITLQAAQIHNAGLNGLTQLAAAGNVNLTTLTTGRSTDTTGDGKNHHRTSTTMQVGTTVQSAGNVVVQAGHDVNLTAATLSAGNALVVQAGNDINSAAAVDNRTLDAELAGRKQSRAVIATDQTVRGSTLGAGSDIVLQAGNDITLQAATMISEAGGIALAAGRDVNLTTANQTHGLQVDETKKKSGLLSSKTTTTHDKVVDTYAVGTVISGETVQIAAGRDIGTQAAQIAGAGDVLLAAGRNIDIGTGENTHTEEHDKSVKQSGLFSGGGVGFTIGTRKTDTTADIEETTHTGSLIGSIGGRVDIVAGGDVTVTGSDVLSKEGIGIVGQNVTIQAAEDATQVTETQKFKQSGINVSLKGGAVDTALAVKGSVERASEVKDDRLAALHVAKAGQTLFSGGTNSGMNSMKNIGSQADDISNAAKTGEGTEGSGLSLRIGIGASSSSSTMEYNATAASGSRIASEGDVVIHATGDGQGNGGDLTVTGSRIEGDNVTLAAARDLLLQSQRETREQIERNKASSGEIGITIGSEAGIGVYVAASMAKGKGDGSGTTHAETTVDAGNTLTLISGRDTTLEGAQARGETVIANIGRDLALTSQQDTNDYKRKDVSAGIDVAVGTGGASVSGYANMSKIDSTYTSVKEQTGIQAGAGGFDIQVGGHTALTGAAIASTADSALNRLSTQSLSATDLKNEAEYKAISIGVSGGTSGGVSGSFSHQDDKASSITRSGISAGTLDIRDGATVASLDRSVTSLQQDGLKEIFDQRKVSETMELGQLAGEVGMRAAGDLAGKMGWEEGSKEKVILHGIVGAGIAALGGGNPLEGLAGAAASQLATLAMQNYLRENDIDPNSPQGRMLMELGSLAVGAAAGGRSGAATALAGEQFNRQLHPDEKALIRGELSDKYAAANGLTKEEAVQVLEAQLFRMVDADAASTGVWDAQAYVFLKNYAYAHNSPTIGYDQWGGAVPLFGTSAGYQRQDSTIFSANPQMTNPPRAGSAMDYFTGAFGSVPERALETLGNLLNPLDTLGDMWGGVVGFVKDPLGTGRAIQESTRDMADAAQGGNLKPAGEFMGGQTVNALLGAGLGQWVTGKWVPGDSVVDAGIHWGKGIQGQGMPWENYMATQLPAGSRLPAGFKTFDFFDANTSTAISAKTLDTMTSSKLSNPKQVYSSLKGNIDDAAGFTNAQLGGRVLGSLDIASRELRVAVPAGTTPAQWQQIQRAVEYGKQRGVTVLVTKVKGGG